MEMKKTEDSYKQGYELYKEAYEKLSGDYIAHLNRDIERSRIGYERGSLYFSLYAFIFIGLSIATKNAGEKVAWLVFASVCCVISAYILIDSAQRKKKTK